MRFTAAIISALALASIGVQSAPAPQEEEVSAESFGKPPQTGCKWVCPKPEPKCGDYCVFKDWDLSQNVRILTTFLKGVLTVNHLDLTDLNITRPRLADQLNPRIRTDAPKTPSTSSPSESTGASFKVSQQ